MKKYASLKSIFVGIAFIILAFPAALSARISLPLSPLDIPLEPVLALDTDPEPQVPDDNQTDGDIPKPKTGDVSEIKAILYSLVVPGAGHFYLDEKGRGEVFLGAEVVAWAGFFAFRTYGKWREDDYIRLAEDHAGIDPSGKDEDFYKNLAFYDSRDQYNKSGRIINPGAEYYPAGRYYYWQWDSDASRLEYRDIRNSSETAFRNAGFMIVMTVVNRVLAGIDSYRLAKKISNRSISNYGLDDNTKIKFRANPFGSNPKIFVGVTHQF